MSIPRSLFILNFVNDRPHEAMDEQAGAQHGAFLARHLEAGTLLVAGAKMPRTGGIIIARGTRQAIDDLVAEAPFVRMGFARVEVIEFGAVVASPELRAWLERG